MEIDDIEPDAVFDFALTNLVQVRSPSAILREIVGTSFRKQNMSGVAAVHYPLCDRDTNPSHIRSLIDIDNFIDRPAVDSNAHRQGDMRFQSRTACRRRWS